MQLKSCWPAAARPGGSPPPHPTSSSKWAWLLKSLDKQYVPSVCRSLGHALGMAPADHVGDAKALQICCDAVDFLVSN